MLTTITVALALSILILARYHYRFAQRHDRIVETALLALRLTQGGAPPALTAPRRAPRKALKAGAKRGPRAPRLPRKQVEVA